MDQFDSNKDYYDILGADERASRREINHLYKRKAARHHPDLGGSEEEMKSLNEAYGILKNETTRRAYDAQRRKPAEAAFVPVSSPPAQDFGLFGQGLSAFLCLFVGLFLLFLVRFQWIWFLWPLAILAVFVVFFGILMARGAMRSFNESLPLSNPLRRHTRLQEAVFWSVVGGGVYGVYLILSA
jgi:DnaJ-like protein